MKEYCKCEISSPSSHHKHCINDRCGKEIKSIYQKYGEQRKEIDRLTKLKDKAVDITLAIAVEHNIHVGLLGEAVVALRGMGRYVPLADKIEQHLDMSKVTSDN